MRGRKCLVIILDYVSNKKEQGMKALQKRKVPISTQKISFELKVNWRKYLNKFVSAGDYSFPTIDHEHQPQPNILKFNNWRISLIYSDAKLPKKAWRHSKIVPKILSWNQFLTKLLRFYWLLDISTIIPVDNYNYNSLGMVINYLKIFQISLNFNRQRRSVLCNSSKKLKS